MRRIFHAHPRMFLTAAEFIIEVFRKTANYFVAQIVVLIITLASIDTGLGISDLSSSQQLALDLSVSNVLYGATLIVGVFATCWYFFRVLNQLTGVLTDRFNLVTTLWSAASIIMLRKFQVTSIYNNPDIIAPLIIIAIVLVFARRHILDFVYIRTVSALRSDNEAIQPAYPFGLESPVKFRNSIRYYSPPTQIWSSAVSIGSAVRVESQSETKDVDIPSSESNADDVVGHLSNESKNMSVSGDGVNDHLVSGTEITHVVSDDTPDTKIEAEASEVVLTGIKDQVKRGRDFVKRKKTVHRPVRNKGSRFVNGRGIGKPYSNNPRTVRKLPHSRKH